MCCRAPVLFYKPVTSIIGPGANIVIPKVTQPITKHLPDYEVELTIVIGRPAKDVKEEDALDYVLGYTCGNDVRVSCGPVTPQSYTLPFRYHFASTK